MCRKAMRKLWPYVLANRVELQYGSVDHLPFVQPLFDACFHVDCFYFWPSLTYSLGKIWKMLHPNGRIVTTFQSKQLVDFMERGWFQYGNPDPLAYVLALEQCGFDRIEWLKNRIHFNSQEEAYDCIIAYKPVVQLLTV
ncbi:unnamed protein product [Heterobilharzia americana]|nr:unnamed protein product [Heterobilharzia americana]